MESEHLRELLARKDSLETMLSGIDIKLLVFGALVLIGIAGETWYGVRTWIGNKQLRFVQRQIDDEKDGESRVAAEQTKAEVDKVNKNAALANQGLIKSNEHTATLEKQTEELKMQAAASETEAAAARLELEKIKEKQRPRMLTPEQITRFDSIVKTDMPEQITVTALISDTEALSFAEQIKLILQDAGYMVIGVNQAMYRDVRSGVWVLMKNPKAPIPSIANLFGKAFATVGMPVKGGISNSLKDEQSIEILIGTKP